MNEMKMQKNPINNRTDQVKKEICETEERTLKLSSQRRIKKNSRKVKKACLIYGISLKEKKFKIIGVPGKDREKEVRKLI